MADTDGCKPLCKIRTGTHAEAVRVMDAGPSAIAERACLSSHDANAVSSNPHSD